MNQSQRPFNAADRVTSWSPNNAAHNSDIALPIPSGMPQNIQGPGNLSYSYNDPQHMLPGPAYSDIYTNESEYPTQNSQDSGIFLTTNSSNYQPTESTQINLEFARGYSGSSIPGPSLGSHPISNLAQFGPNNPFWQIGPAPSEPQQYINTLGQNIPSISFHTKTSPFCTVRPTIGGYPAQQSPRPSFSASEQPSLVCSNQQDQCEGRCKPLWMSILKKISRMDPTYREMETFTMKNFSRGVSEFLQDASEIDEFDNTPTALDLDDARLSSRQKISSFDRRDSSRPHRANQRRVHMGRVEKHSGARQLRSQSDHPPGCQSEPISRSLTTDAVDSSNYAEALCTKGLTEEYKEINKSAAWDRNRPYACPFLCGETFTKPCDLKRHLKQYEGYVCSVGRRWTDGDGRRRCSVCSEEEPDENHFESKHSGFEACVEKEWRFDGGRMGRFHPRRDKFGIHVRHVHPKVDFERAEYVYYKPPSTGGQQCGFCGKLFPSTDEFSKHIARQFKDGRTMAEWREPWNPVPPPNKPCNTKGDFTQRKDDDDDDDNDDDDGGPNDNENHDGQGPQYEHNPDGGGNLPPGGSNYGFGSSRGASNSGLDEVGHFNSGYGDMFENDQCLRTQDRIQSPEFRVSSLIDTMDTCLPVAAKLVNSMRSRAHTLISTIFWFAISSDVLTSEELEPNSVKIQKGLGKGAYSHVDKVIFKDRGLQLARKKVHSLALLDSGAQNRFLREFSVTVWALHPHIVSLRGLLINNLEWSLLIEPVADMTLRQVLGMKPSERKLQAIFSKGDFGCIAAGIQHLHRHGIIHGDLKPENILWQMSGHYRLCDFGTASISPSVRPAEFTPRYAAPEIIRGGLLSTSSDIWSLGCIYWEIRCWISGRQDDRLSHRGSCSFDSASRPDLTGILSSSLKQEVNRTELPHLLFWGLSKRQNCCIFRMLNRDPVRRPSIQDVLTEFPSRLCCSNKVFSPGHPSALELLQRLERPTSCLNPIYRLDVCHRIFTLMTKLEIPQPLTLTQKEHATASCYSPLQSRHIRLLRVASDSHGPIRCRLTSVSVDSGQKYCAISHVWGSTQEIDSMELDGFTFPVTRSISQALRAIRADSYPHYVWCDSLCINQSHAKERLSQIRLLPDIYRRASVVVISMEAPQTLETDHRSALNDNYILDLAKRTWFRRLWICQELSVAQHAHVSLGREIIPWKMFCSAFLDAFERSFTSAASIVLTSSNWALSSAVEMLMTIERLANINAGRKELSLLDLLKFFSRYETDDPRDKVFSLLAFRNEVDHLGLRIDYTRSVWDVYVDAARSCLRYGLIDVLSSCSRRGPLSDKLPSWVPDWSATEHRSLDLPSFRACSTGAGTKSPSVPHFQVVHLSREKVTHLLLLEGTLVDVIEERFVGFKHISEADFFFHNWDLLERKSLRKMYGEKLSDAVFKTAIADREPGQLKGWGWRRSSINEFSTLFTKELSGSHPFSTYWATFNYLRVSRTMFSTAKGYIGLGPDDIVEGDRVVLFLGTRVPFILRQLEDDNYILLGDAYVHGLMDGEFMQKCPSLKTIRLR